ncbi:MAG TPA: prepilin-type N-terminal cleavage/methylation domain-containing protein [Candidatus Hydrogenedentes bacterium]|mgnify:CR=1 FL=1|nr:prepilin-type N-terminal cleavage/methylation domain-containing protein [Candidatus Hydrogenedentota bacterium]
MSKKSGFTLIELMIVVAIIAIIAAIAIPNLLRSRMQSNESAAIGNLRTICGAEVAYHSANYQYAITFDALTTPPAAGAPAYLEGAWGAPKSGYNYTMGGTAANFSSNADPETMNQTGSKGFFVDASGVIRYAVGAAADANATPIGQTS